MPLYYIIGIESADDLIHDLKLAFGSYGKTAV